MALNLLRQEQRRHSVSEPIPNAMSGISMGVATTVGNAGIVRTCELTTTMTQKPGR